jgi:hypothetical protein
LLILAIGFSLLDQELTANLSIPCTSVKVPTCRGEQIELWIEYAEQLPVDLQLDLLVVPMQAKGARGYQYLGPSNPLHLTQWSA